MYMFFRTHFFLSKPKKYDNKSETNILRFDGIGVEIVSCLGLAHGYKDVFNKYTEIFIQRYLV